MFSSVIVPNGDRARQVQLRSEEVSCFASNSSGDVLDIGSKLAKIFKNHREAVPNFKEGFSGWKAKSYKAINPLANWLKEENHLSGTEEKLNDVDFACSLGFLTRVGATPHSHTNTAWRAEALNINGVIHIAQVAAGQDEKLKQAVELREYAKEKFVEILTSPTTTAESPDNATSSCEDAADCFSAVRKATFSSGGNELKCLFIGKVDCLSKDGKKIALKLVPPMRLGKKMPSPQYYHKCIKWWLESRLMGFDHMYFGEYDETGVRNIERVRFGSQRQGSLSPDEKLFVDIGTHANEILQLIDDVLRFIKNSLPNDNDCCFVEKKRYTSQLAITVKNASHLRVLTPRTREEILKNALKLSNNNDPSTET